MTSFNVPRKFWNTQQIYAVLEQYNKYQSPLYMCKGNVKIKNNDSLRNNTEALKNGQ